MITNPNKYQAIVLANTNHVFSFHVNSIKIPVKDSIDFLGVNIDKNLQFNSFQRIFVLGSIIRSM